MSHRSRQVPDDIRPQLAKLEEIEKRGALQLLLALHHNDLYITEIIKRHPRDGGIITQPALEKTRILLLQMGLIEEYDKFIELTNKTRTYIRLTEKGRVVAERVKTLAESLM